MKVVFSIFVNNKLSKMKSKVTEVSAGNVGVWDSANGTLYKYKYKFEDGVELTAQHKEDKAKFIVGDEVEYEITRTHETYGNSGKVSKPNDFGGNKKPVMTSYVEVIRTCKSNAIHAMCEVNGAYNASRLNMNDVKTICAFTLGDIRSEIPKFGEESNLFTSRLAAVNNAAISAKFNTYTHVSQLIDKAKEFYEYVKG